MHPYSTLAADLARLVGEHATDDPRILRSVSGDFGGMVRRLPAAAVRPRSAAHVAEVLRYASRNGVPVSTRSKGHSLGGQTLSDGGIVLDMRSMDRVLRVDTGEEWVEAEPGATWRDVVGATLAEGLIPPVLTGTLQTTVGGTHSMGGLGHASFRHGVQAGHCLGAEVVTADGEIRWCSASENPDLFAHVLCGLGQVGVVTRIRHRLRRHRAHARSRKLYYTNRARMLADLQHLARDGGMDQLAGYGWPIRGRFAYAIELTHETDSTDLAVGAADLQGLHFDAIAEGDTHPFAESILRTPSADPRDSVVESPSQVNLWVDGLMPVSAVQPYFTEMMSTLPQPVLDRSTCLFWPVAQHPSTPPLFMIPGGEPVILAGIFPTMPIAEAELAAEPMSRAGERIAAYGGKRYLYGWLQMDEAGWRTHFGARWDGLLRAKAAYDPAGILNPGFIRYGQDVAGTSRLLECV